jgi:hypothetical protein
MALGDVGVDAFDLDKAFGADFLIAAAGSVQKRGVVEETNRTFYSILI